MDKNLFVYKIKKKTKFCYYLVLEFDKYFNINYIINNRNIHDDHCKNGSKSVFIDGGVEFESG